MPTHVFGSVMLILSPVVPVVSSGGANRAVLADLELDGPLERVVLQVSPYGETHLEGSLLTGEHRRLRVPVPLPSAEVRFEPKISWDTDAGGSDAPRGRARFLGWRDDDTSGVASLSPALRARPRPPLERIAARAGAASALVLAACLVLAMAWRRRVMASLSVAAVGSVAMWVLARGPAPGAPARIVVLEGAAGESRWLRIEAACDRLVVSTEARDLCVESQPTDVPLLWSIPLESGKTWSVSGRGARLYRAAVFEPGERSLTRAANRMERLAEVWVRDESAWKWTGGWDLGRPLPSLQEGPAPPGWLAAGLPQGTDILLGRIDAPDESGPVFLRLSGF